ncbi:carboxypeptidase-like regulatory domain-containing protein [Porphyromonas gulae]|nr:carboxypeptidase-like regulatory domain-containing protein [Porphyromonas gulae]
MMNRAVSSILVGLWLCLAGLLPVAAQGAAGQMLAGRVIDAESREPLAGAVCQLLDASGKPLAFVLSKADGSFSLEKKAGGKLLSVRHMGYRKMSKAIDAAVSSLLFALVPADVKLKEVVVRAEPVRKLGDTIAYSAAAFVGPDDRYLADLLRKLPGIEVSANGLIKYQGEPITHMYIEGVDMLQGRYNLASQNMPQEAVKTVEVLEGHQHIKTLRETVPEKRAALNIKLKERFKMRPFGEVTAGGGFSELWTGRLFGMQISRKVQALLTVKGNNTGHSVNEEAIRLLDIDGIMYNASDREEVLTHAGFRSLPMSQSRYLMNRSGTGSFSTAIPLGADMTLTANASLLTDRREQTILQEQTYNLSTPQEVSVREDRYTKNKARSAQADFSFENNASRFYLKDDLKLTLGSDREEVRLATNTADYLQTGKSLPRIVQNNLTAVLKDDRRSYRLFSFGKYMARDENMLLSEPATGTLQMDPDVRMRDWVTRNGLESDFRFGRVALHSTTTMGYRGGQTDYRSSLSQPEVEGFGGTYGYRAGHWELSETPSFSYRFGRTYHRLDLPVAWHLFTLNDESEEGRRQASRATFSPALSLHWELGAAWKLNASVRHGHSYGGLEGLRSGYTRRDYRTYLLPSGFMSERRYSGANFSVDYGDVLHLFYLHLKAGYSRSRSNELPHFDYSEERNIIRYERYWHDLDAFFADMRLSKFFFPVKANAVLNLRYSRSESLLKQSGHLIGGRGNSLSAELTLSKRWGGRLSASYNLAANYSWMETGANAHRWLPHYRHAANLTFLPILRLTMRMAGEYNATTLEPGHMHEDVFFDCEARYSINKIWEVTVSMRNLFDRRTYLIRQLSEYNTFSTSIPIRGRELIATVFFRY